MSNKNTLSILYLTLRDFPRRVANRVQTMKMAEALSSFCNLTLSVSKLNAPKKELFNYYGIPDNFDIHEFGEPRFGPHTLMLLPAVLNLIYSSRPDYIFVREEYPAWILSKLFSNIIYEMHDFNPEKLWLYRSIVNNSRVTVVITSALVEKCKRYGIPVEHVQVLSGGVDLSLFQNKIDKSEARALLDLPERKHLVMYSGRLREWKGIYTLIDSLHYLDDDAMLVLVGGFEGEKELVERFVEKHGLNGRVILCGHQDHRKIPVYLTAADILVLPNSGKTEESRHHTSPLKMFEYMASNRPIIASDLPSIREVLDENTAVLIEPDSPRKLAAGIKDIIEDPDKSSLLVDNARKIVQGYSWVERARSLISSLHNHQ